MGSVVRSMCEAVRTTAFVILCGAILLGCARDDRSPVAAFEAATWPGSRVVSLTVNSCNGSPRAQITAETPGEVRVRVEARDSTDDCADAVRVCLEAPLGERPLVDETSGDGIPVLVQDDPAIPDCPIPAEE